jgi:prevent-host-death family protein
MYLKHIINKKLVEMNNVFVVVVKSIKNVVEGVNIMFSTHVKAVRDLRNNYPEIASIIKERNNVIITNNGKSEAVIIPYEDFSKYEEYLHIRYVKEKLAEAEAIADNPGEWSSADELFKEWDSWGAVKL